jgi:hypothetical protein
MISLQPAFFISVRMPLIMVKTVTAMSEQIAPKRAQSTHEGMLMVAVMMDGHRQVKREAVSNAENRKNAMTLTPLFSGDMATGSRCVWRIVARHLGKSNEVQNEIKTSSNKNQTKTATNL